MEKNRVWTIRSQHSGPWEPFMPNVANKNSQQYFQVKKPSGSMRDILRREPMSS